MSSHAVLLEWRSALVHISSRLLAQKERSAEADMRNPFHFLEQKNECLRRWSKNSSSRALFYTLSSTSAGISLAFLDLATPEHDADIFWFCEHSRVHLRFTVFPTVQAAIEHNQTEFWRPAGRTTSLTFICVLANHNHTCSRRCGFLRPRRHENTMRSNAAMFWKNTRGVCDNEDRKAWRRRSFYAPSIHQAPLMGKQAAVLVYHNHTWLCRRYVLRRRRQTKTMRRWDAHFGKKKPEV